MRRDVEIVTESPLVTEQPSTRLSRDLFWAERLNLRMLGIINRKPVDCMVSPRFNPRYAADAYSHQ